MKTFFLLHFRKKFNISRDVYAAGINLVFAVHLKVRRTTFSLFNGCFFLFGSFTRLSHESVAGVVVCFSHFAVAEHTALLLKKKKHIKAVRGRTRTSSCCEGTTFVTRASYDLRNVYKLELLSLP